MLHLQEQKVGNCTLLIIMEITNGVVLLMLVARLFLYLIQSGAAARGEVGHVPADEDALDRVGGHCEPPGELGARDRTLVGVAQCLPDGVKPRGQVCRRLSRHGHVPSGVRALHFRE